MTSAQIRQSFLDFFKSKGHTIVPSSPLLPDSPNLLFTNAGMNQFVPIFLGQKKADVSKWANVVPDSDTRAADTQKCIRAGGKHNDLDDVGLDTYHHTFFEMLGNWSFGDYFKKEAIDWAWELVVGKWQFPPRRLYATVYAPDKAQNDPSDFDQEAWGYWAEKFKSVGLDPKIHIVKGNKKDNFWMMGETGPCGPCSEIHVDLTPEGNTEGLLVNKGDARCIEIWNLVFIQYNANPDGTFSPLPARHVDTGMGFERVTSIIQGTKGLKDFVHAKISNYETDIFRPIFDALEKLSGKKYGSTLPGAATQSEEVHLKSSGECEPRIIEVPEVPARPGPASDEKGMPDDPEAVVSQEQVALDIAFRVIADHIRTLSFAIADGIQPSNEGRGYVLRRILRRAVRYGRTLGFHEPFFYKLVDVLVETMSGVFPEIRAKRKHVQDTIRFEEEAFDKTLDNGIEMFENSIRELSIVNKFLTSVPKSVEKICDGLLSIPDAFPVRETELEADWAAFILDVDGKLRGMFIDSLSDSVLKGGIKPVGIMKNWGDRMQMLCKSATDEFSALQQTQKSASAFEICRARILKELEILKNTIPDLIRETATVFPVDIAFKLFDTHGFPLDLTELMARERGLSVDKQGFEELMEEQRERGKAAQKKTVITVQEGVDLVAATKFVGYEETKIKTRVLKVLPQEKHWAVILAESPFYAEMGGQVGDSGTISLGANFWRVLDTKKMHSTWLHIIGEAAPPQVGLVDNVEIDTQRRNAIQRHHTVTHLLHWALHEVVSREASQKGSYVGPEKLTFDFNSAALTPQQVADIEKLVNERILENAGVSWTEVPYTDVRSRKDVMQFFGDKYGDVVRVVQIGGHAAKLDGYSMELCGGTHTRATGEIGLFRIAAESAIAAGVRRIEAVAGLEAYRRANEELQLIKSLAGRVNSPVHELEKKIESLLEQQKALEKSLKTATMREASNVASNLLEHSHAVNGIPALIHNVGGVDGDFLQAVADSLKGRFKGVIVLGGASGGAVSLVAAVSPDWTSKVQAGKIIQQIAQIVGGKGGGKPDNARGGGKDAGKLEEALAKAKSLLG
ncbi:MAG TPA: alanine--tRNA ligase [Verrucomicrobiae bacterium]|nr:alanine--tRNA ligase [Verrucomicrobiae bacterium]